jgi:HAD superfamily hydrolase (TIGR01450 family)
MALSPFVAGYDQFILDLDGTVYVGGEPIDGSPEAIAELRAAGKQVSFVTNNSRGTGEEYVQRLWTMGIQASVRDVVTVGGAMQHLLAETTPGQSAYVIGTQAMVDHVDAAGLRVLNGTDMAVRADVVVVSGTDELVYDDLRVANLALRAGATFLATGRDPTYPMPDGLWPGIGSIVAALEVASDKKASIVGKPEPQLYLTALDRMGEGRTLAVGDKVEADIAAAKRVGLDAVLVLTGGTTRAEGEAAQDPKPDRIADTLARLVLGDTA